MSTLRLVFIGTKGWIVALNAPGMNLVWTA